MQTMAQMSSLREAAMLIRLSISDITWLNAAIKQKKRGIRLNCDRPATTEKMIVATTNRRAIAAKVFDSVTLPMINDIV